VSADARARARRSALYQSGLEVSCGGQRDYRLWEGVPGHPRHLLLLHRAGILFWDVVDWTNFRSLCHRRERCGCRAAARARAARGSPRAALRLTQGRRRD
jgi:hypothetical protein